MVNCFSNLQYIGRLYPRHLKLFTKGDSVEEQVSTPHQFWLTETCMQCSLSSAGRQNFRNAENRYILHVQMHCILYKIQLKENFLASLRSNIPIQKRKKKSMKLQNSKVWNYRNSKSWILQHSCSGKSASSLKASLHLF